MLILNQGKNIDKDRFIENGYNVYRYDARGHGKSEGKRGHLEDFEDYLDDLDIKSEGIIEDLFEKEETFSGQNIILGLLTIILLAYSYFRNTNIQVLELLYIPKVYSTIYFLLITPYIVLGFKYIRKGL